MEFPLIIVDAFTLNDQPFSGNTAAVCLLKFDDDISDEIKQKIASQMNLCVTAFVAKTWSKDLTPEEDRYTLRWFTPNTEIELCGHGTLAAAQVVFEKFEQENNSVKFETKFKGIIEAKADPNRKTISLDFPLNTCKPIDIKTNPLVEDIVCNTLGLMTDHIRDVQICEGMKTLLIRLKDTDENLMWKVSPNFSLLGKEPKNDQVKLVLVTQQAKNETYIGFNSRAFAPWIGVNEDPVCGLAHTVLAPYWKKQFEANGVLAEQLIGKHCSERGGIVKCKVVGERVQLSGRTRNVLKGIMMV